MVAKFSGLVRKIFKKFLVWWEIFWSQSEIFPHQTRNFFFNLSKKILGGGKIFKFFSCYRNFFKIFLVRTRNFLKFFLTRLKNFFKNFPHQTRKFCNHPYQFYSFSIQTGHNTNKKFLVWWGKFLVRTRIFFKKNCWCRDLFEWKMNRTGRNGCKIFWSWPKNFSPD